MAGNGNNKWWLDEDQTDGTIDVIRNLLDKKGNESCPRC